MKSDHSLTLLLIEDSESDARLLQESILQVSRGDLSVTVAATLQEALGRLRDHPVDAALSDLLLPDSSGLETVSRLREACPNIPIVVLTGADDQTMGVEAVRMGVQDYLVKGQVDGRLIMRAVRYAIERKRAEDALRQARDELETRVNERTLELARTVENLQDEVARRTLAEASLQERSRLLEAFFRHAATPVMFLDPSFTFIRVNEAYAKACQRDVTEFPGHNYFELFPHPENQAIFENVVRTKTPYQAMARAFTFPDHPDWGVTYLNWALTPIVDSEGEVEFLVLAQEDVTERTQAHEQIMAVNEALTQRTVQLRALTSELTLAEQRERQRLAQILHDHLQQYLVAAKLHVAPLARSESAQVRQTASEVNDLIRDAIAASRSLTAELSPPILREGGLIEALRWLARWMRETHELEVWLSLDDKAVPHEEDVSILLFQAVRELLFNVAKHAGVKSASVSVARVGAEIRIVVADEGTGFEPSRIRTEGGLTGGFGLFSVRERLGYVGGHMEIDSAPGKGSRFTLVVPAAEPEVVRPAAPGLASVPGQQRAPQAAGKAPTRTRVLLVDDHMVTRQGLARLLGEEPDIEVIAQAADGLTATRLARELVPDIVIMDVSMPGMSGIDATLAIHTELPQVKVIGLSMYDEEERGQAMRHAGAVAYLTKSGPPEAVIAAVRAHAGKEEAHQAPPQGEPRKRKTPLSKGGQKA